MKTPTPKLCECCLGVGSQYQASRKATWPCPHCEGKAHPSSGPEFIRTNTRIKSLKAKK